MIRKIIKIDEKLCNGCGLCVSACHEGAIGMVGGKARLLREDYCDGLGNCLPVCPAGAISFEERDAAPFDEKAAAKNAACTGGCPGARAKTLERTPPPPRTAETEFPSRLGQWPAQIKLVPVNAAFFSGAELLIAADCTAYAYAAFHERFMRGKITLIGCPKLDSVDYSEKLAAIIAGNNIKSVTVVRMEVPCCSQIVSATAAALGASGKTVPFTVITISTDGRVLDE